MLPTLPGPLKTRLERCSTLPTLPAIAVRVLQLCQSDDIDLKAIADTIGKDPALSAKVLRLVNSPMFALRQEVRTVPHALALLGLNAVRTLALSFSLVRDLQRKQQASLQAYWKRSIIAAIAARELAVAVRFVAPDEAFLGGLLQDIGVLALRSLGGDAYQKLADKAGDSHVHVAELEQEMFGADHAEVGAWLAGTWRLPAPLCHAIAFSHRSPVELASAGLPDDVVKLLRLVRVSGSVADVWSRSSPAAATAILNEEGPRILRLGPGELEPVLKRTAAAMPEIATLFDMKLGSAQEIASVLDEASETLVMVSLRASRQVDVAREAIDDLQQKTKVLEEASQRDKLTGVYNRARLDAYVVDEFATAQRTGKPLSLIMGDVDHFKKVNDTYGHPMGDRVLRAVAAALGNRLRPRDLVARYGGEEFVLVLPETDAAGAAVVAERLRAKVASIAATQTVAGEEAALPPVTMSFGCATVNPARFGTGADALAAADAALYAAKRAGRDRVVCHGGGENATKGAGAGALDAAFDGAKATNTSENGGPPLDTRRSAV